MTLPGRAASPQLAAVLDAVVGATGEGAVVDGRDLRCKCPLHHGHSLMLADGDQAVMVRCEGGCDPAAVVRHLGFKWRDLFYAPGPVPRTTVPAAAARRSPFERVTMAMLSRHCGVPANVLEALGWHEGDFVCTSRKGTTYHVHGVGVPYWRDRVGGTAELVKVRVGVTPGHQGAKYVTQVAGTPAGVYGLFWLGHWNQHCDYLWIVEGETDYAALAGHGFPVLALPGADTVGLLERCHVEGFKRLYVAREPDAGGDTLATKVHQRLREIGWAGEAFAVTMPGRAKDVCELLKRDPSNFVANVQAALGRGRAVPLAEAGKKMLVWGNQVQTEEIRFFLSPYFVRGGLSLVVGEPDIGKSYFMMATAAAVTTGRVIPGCDPEVSDLGEGRVVVVAREDRFQDVLLPRFLAAGGDPVKVAFFDFEKHDLNFGDVARVRAVIDEGRPDAIWFDPLSEMLPSGTDLRDQNAVKAVMTPVIDLAREHGIAMLAVGHTPKHHGTTAATFTFGSIQFYATARSGVAIQLDRTRQETGHTFGVGSPLKGNWGPKGKSFRYEISKEVADERFPWVGSWRWGETSDETLVEILQQRAVKPVDPRHVRQAEQFLREVLGPGQERTTDELQRRARELMIPQWVLKAAADRLRLKTVTAPDGRATWSLPVAEPGVTGEKW